MQPTVLLDVPEDCPAVTEETFGPTLTIAKVPDMDEAVRRANASSYGLGATVFSRAHGTQLARRIRAGLVAVNSVISFAGMPSLPWGGIGQSGFGRIHGPDGLREFTTAKAIARQRFTLAAAPDHLRPDRPRGQGGRHPDHPAARPRQHPAPRAPPSAEYKASAPRPDRRQVVLVTGAARASASHHQGAATPAAPTVVHADLRQDAIDAVRGELGRDRILAFVVDVTAQHRPRHVVATIVDRLGKVAGDAGGQEGLGTDIDDAAGSSAETGQRNCCRCGPTSAWSPTVLSRRSDGIRGSTRVCARVTACGDREGAKHPPPSQSNRVGHAHRRTRRSSSPAGPCGSVRDGGYCRRRPVSADIEIDLRIAAEQGHMLSGHRKPVQIGHTPNRRSACPGYE